MKTKIVNFLKTDRSYANGVALYQEHGAAQAFKITLNRSSQSEFLQNLLFEELRKLAGIHVDDFKYILAHPVLKAAVKAEEKAVIDKTPVLIITGIPEEIQKAIRLRSDFPFLANDDCPNELKILVADRITAYHKYVEAHPALFEATSAEEIAILAATVVENYMENQDIWNELNYFKENGVVLGLHPIFEQQKREKEINDLTMGELVKLRDQLKNYIPRTKKDMKDNPDAPENQERQSRVSQWEWEQGIVNNLLKVAPQKATPAKPNKAKK